MINRTRNYNHRISYGLANNWDMLCYCLMCSVVVIMCGKVVSSNSEDMPLIKYSTNLTSDKEQHISAQISVIPKEVKTDESQIVKMPKQEKNIVPSARVNRNTKHKVR